MLACLTTIRRNQRDEFGIRVCRVLYVMLDQCTRVWVDVFTGNKKHIVQDLKDKHCLWVEDIEGVGEQNKEKKTDLHHMVLSAYKEKEVWALI
nr:hypothetical protein [Tanacetum cinerariifolium]